MNVLNIALLTFLVLLAISESALNFYELILDGLSPKLFHRFLHTSFLVLATFILFSEDILKGVSFMWLSPVFIWQLYLNYRERKMKATV
jgi:hypothetical protein